MRRDGAQQREEKYRGRLTGKTPMDVQWVLKEVLWLATETTRSKIRFAVQGWITWKKTQPGTCGKLVRLTRLMITRNCKELTNIVPQYAINANAQLALHVSPSRCFPVVKCSTAVTRPQKVFQSSAGVQDVVRARLIDDCRVVAPCLAVKKLTERLLLIFSMATKQK